MKRGILYFCQNKTLNLKTLMKNQRLMSLDVLRGFDMFFIMGLSGLITAICALAPGEFTDTIALHMKHVSWDGLQHHDTIFPLFLFLAGVSFPFSLAKQRSSGMSSWDIHKKILRRAALLILFGLIYNGLFKLDFSNLRCASVLARIGIAWAIAAILTIHFKLKARIIIASVILVGYGLLSKFVAAPDMPGSDPLSMDGCLVGYIDRLFLPGRLLYNNGNFDPEGLLSALPAVVTALLGVFTGELIQVSDKKLSGNQKTLWMLAGALVLALVAWAFHGVLPINKMLWSSTFVCAVGAYSLLLMALFYYVIDVRGWKKWAFIFQVVGMNSITIYMAQRIINFNGISKFFFGGIANLCPEAWGNVVMSVGFVTVAWLFLYFLYRQKIFLKV